MAYFLGADVGGTKTHVVVADQDGRVLGFGRSGPGNPEGVGPEGLLSALSEATTQALKPIGLAPGDLAGAGLGIAGYDWPEDLPLMVETVAKLGLSCPNRIVNDAVPGLVIGARDGWGVSVIAGTGCNCCGWDREHRREGRVTGHGWLMGEFAGASELVMRAMQMVSYAWIKRIEPTALTDAFIAYVGAVNADDLIAGYTAERYHIGPKAASLVFDVAATGDAVAVELIDWAGQELGEMAKAVIRQLDFQQLEFDVVMAGGMFAGGERLIESLRRTVVGFAPGARLVHLSAPPVLGAALIGMEQTGLHANDAVRATLAKTYSALT